MRSSQKKCYMLLIGLSSVNTLSRINRLMFLGFELEISWTWVNVETATQILEPFLLYSQFKLEAQLLTCLGKFLFSAINTFRLTPVNQMSYLLLTLFCYIPWTYVLNIKFELKCYFRKSFSFFPPFLERNHDFVTKLLWQTGDFH